ncbi:aspartate aminotransferase family protein [Oceanidesulfovibrio marinus]|uniref:Acetylornithine aminotransferase n=1 Tax=Oceanidesulfovibrio marinus TaxID=370038 RepID=A0A6P1ZEB4_9BACT|nr:aspartate aminotransferase family protein [Oceanidesulfovibrio marinus]QJT08540.1 aspartate aminotransferase family protein [Oceanidesulfovibrio marinus]TVM32994.1 aspartate aminotransferase family protein [Oceanidesulfovibrio marinus]
MSDKFNTLKARTESVLCNTYGRYPMGITKAVGSRLTDLDGREYVDLLAGIAVCNLGHSRPEIARVMAEQAQKLVHVSNLFYQEEQVAYAEELTKWMGLGKAFFCNSGAEANEGAIKLARRYMRTIKKRDAYEIVTLDGSFHGRTLATLTATGQPKVKEYFGPLPEGFVTVPWNDPAALDKAITDKTAAVLVELIQGEGGVRPMSTEYAVAVERICRDKDVLLMVDEIQTGMGRTGNFMAYQHYGLSPDVVTLAKGLANGLPMGAVVATDDAAAGFAPGAHATTFGGGGVITAVALEVLRIMKDEDLVNRARTEGQHFLGRLHDLVDEFPDQLEEARGVGLICGLVFKEPAAWAWQAMLAKGFVLNCTQERVLRFLPPLSTPRADLDAAVEALREILSA